MSCGIYRIINLVNNKFYIGSSNNIERRWSKHKRMLNCNKHHSRHLQNSWNKYGQENFIFEIIEECLKEILLEREQWYLDELQCYLRENGFNVCKNVVQTSKGLTYEEIHGEEKAKQLKDQLSRSYEEKFGEEKANEIKAKQSKTFEEIHGEEKAKQLKEQLSERFKKNNPMYIEEYYNKICGENHHYYGKKRKKEECQKISKNRIENEVAKGSKNPAAKLNETKVKIIKLMLYFNLYSRLEIAKMFEVSKGTIKHIVHNRKWKHVNIEEHI